MKTIETQVFEYSELSEKAKEKACEWYLQGALDYRWWGSIYDDAKTVGIKIESFDLYRNRHATGSFVEDACHCADLIIKNHGDTCDTYKLAESFLKARDEIVNNAEKDEDGEFIDVYGLDERLDEVEADFLKDLMEEYSILLENESEYLTSKECIEELIIANEYTFTESGERFG